MKMRFMFLLAAIYSLAMWGSTISSGTLLRISPMPKAPKIDGKIAFDEWKYASTTFGGISPVSGLMTRRENNFRFGYDNGNFYFAVTSEIPFLPQKLNQDDRVELQLLPPGGTSPFMVSVDSTGKGLVPDGVRVANGFAPSILNLENGDCWTVEMAVPFRLLGIQQIKDGEKWGLQMVRRWSSQKENGFWHKPSAAGEMGTFIPDAKAPIISFDGFGRAKYEATGNYEWTYRVENPHKHELGIKSECFRSGVNAAATLDINNPSLFDKVTKVRIGYSKVVKAGGTEYFSLYQMAQFPGKPRLLYSLLQGYNDIVYYQRVMFWDVYISQRAGVYKDEIGLPYLNAGFYPSFGNLLRISVSFHRKLPCLMAVVKVRNSAGKVLHTFARADFGRPIQDFEDQVKLPGLPHGDYEVAMECTGLDEKKYAHVRKFSICSYPWQNLNLGKERVIVPPFRPLKVRRWKKEVHALMTGYKLGKGVWSSVFAEGENILAAPVQFILNGRAFDLESAKFVSVEDDQVTAEIQAVQGKVRLRLKQIYDYDGFCRLEVKVIPQEKVKVESFDLKIPLKNEFMKYYASIRSSRPRHLGKPDYTLPKNEGILKLTGIRIKKGAIIPYIWLGGRYKGFSWILDSQRHFALREDADAQTLSRAGQILTYTQHIVNRPVEWEQPFEFVMGFQATPVKPQPEEYRRMTQHMYDYEHAKGSINSGWMFHPWPLNTQYPIQMTVNGDDSFYRSIIESRGKGVPEAERKKFAEEYLARHKEYLRKHAPLVNLQRIWEMCTNVRYYEGQHYFLMYHNPAFYSYRWPEAKMYQAEWQPFDYPVDNAWNEYIACQTPQYIDKMLYEIRAQIRMGFDGMNFDCFPLGGGFNSVSMNAFREKPGPVPLMTPKNMLQIVPWGIRSCTNLFGWRELMKRTAHLLYVEGKTVFGVPWVELHATDGIAVPVASFCSTVITTECATAGGEYQDRFPEGYILADLTGTQAGVIPRPIVSTLGVTRGVSVEDEVKTLIAFSFGYAMMNHSDQGVRRGFANFQTARDEVFSFGYGRPENRTLPFYGREKQPVVCNAEHIRTTQVIRPDGKALLMIGNMGDEVRAEFDVTGLKYRKYKVTDVFTGKVLPSAVTVVPKHGYALLKIEEL